MCPNKLSETCKMIKNNEKLKKDEINDAASEVMISMFEDMCKSLAVIADKLTIIADSK